MRRLLAAAIFLLAGAAMAQQHKISVQKYETVIYPPIARAARIYGGVKLTIRSSADGAILKVTAEGGHPMLQQYAIGNIQNWKFHCDDCSYGEAFTHQILYDFKVGDGLATTYHFPDTVSITTYSFSTVDTPFVTNKHSALWRLFHYRKQRQSID